MVGARGVFLSEAPRTEGMPDLVGQIKVPAIDGVEYLKGRRLDGELHSTQMLLRL